MVLLMESLSHILEELGDMRGFASYIFVGTSFIY